MPHRQILGLDLLRFLAALMVTGLHLGEEYVPFGGLGVPIFFMLSGFVIAYSAKDAKPLAFAKSRVLRLMPGIWICATVTLALILLNGGEPATVIPRYLKTLVVWPIAPWIEGVYWTLPVEIVFYGVVFVVLIAGRREALPAVLMAIGAISTAYWTVRLAAVTMGFEADAEMYLARYSLMTSGCYFAIGGLVWACFFDRTTLLRLAAIGVFVGPPSSIRYSPRPRRATFFIGRSCWPPWRPWSRRCASTAPAASPRPSGSSGCSPIRYTCCT